MDSPIAIGEGKNQIMAKTCGFCSNVIRNNDFENDLDNLMTWLLFDSYYFLNAVIFEKCQFDGYY